MNAPTAEDLSSLKRKIAKLKKANCPPNVSILKVYHELIKNKSIEKNRNIESILRIRPIRSLSGVVNISILTKPFRCPGECTFCPNESKVPKSYLSGEPAVERAKRLKYDPYIQVKKRIEILEINGHNAEKVDLRVIGGTFSSYSEKYKIWFIKECFRACNEEPSKKYSSKETIKNLWKELEKAQCKNENGKYRIIGLSFETRPDYITKKEVHNFRKLGATKIEIGVQSIYNDVLLKTKRGHNVETTILATEILKNSGFKVSYQVMPNLPLSNEKRDLEMFKEIFKNKNFKPDYLKIYPLALVRNSALYKDYQKGNFKPYTEDELINLLKDIKKEVPYFLRIERVIRDIPAPLIVEGGAKISNLRQKLKDTTCKCIRCREIKDKIQDKEIFLFKEEYLASNGLEFFLSFEDKERKNLYSILRLRINPDNVAIIRELHTYGVAEKIDQKGTIQHKGLGKALIKEAEKIVKKRDIKKILIISGVGVRGYYKKLGYSLEDYYMVKNI